MKKTITTTEVKCDLCGKDLRVNHPSFEGVTPDTHACKECCKSVLEPYVKRVVSNVVMGRRGERVLGEYDG
jgi:hypothetical protein